MSKVSETLEKKLQNHLDQVKKIKARQQAIAARERTKEKEQQRKDETRRKILLGSYLLKKMNNNDVNKEKILAEMNEFLTENRDRKLFDLPLIDDGSAINK